MLALVDTLTIVASIVWGLYLYDLVISVAGFWKLPRPDGRVGWARFAILVCAHDEERVVAGVVESLRAQDYPPERVHVFVVADNCSDRTAEVARQAGATVLERTDETRRTKGYALQWGMEQLIGEGERSGLRFDALCVFDADNLAAPDFLATMSAYLDRGHVAIQAYLDTKNPDESWVTRSIALAYFITNRFWLRARARLGLPATLGGTGLCLAWDVVQKHSWDPGSLADDLELTMRLVLEGVHVSYCHHTRTYDEKPVTLRQCLRQRSRWMQGHNDVALRWIGRVLWAAVRRPSIRCFDAALHLLQPMRLLVSFVCLAALVGVALAAPDHAAVRGAFAFEPEAYGLAALVFAGYPLLLATAEGALGRAIRALLPCMALSFTWIPAIVVGLVRVRRRVWVHTLHAAKAGKAG